MASKPTPLDALIGKAVGIVQQLERMDQKKKLTFGAFLDDAISLAGTTREKVEKLGIDLSDGVARVSLLHYNTMEEVERLIEVLEEIL